MIYPFFLGPEEHRLFSYYRRINLWSYIFFPMIIALNELLIRPRLPAYRESPERFWSMLALLLNAQVPVSVGVSIHVTLGLCALCLATTFVLLPKWGLRAAKISVKHGLPAYAEYKAAYFYFENSIQRFGFFMWHSVLMPVSFFFGVFVPCMVISLFRSLS